MENVLLFNWKNNYGDDIIVISNNHLDLKRYLENELGFSVIDFEYLDKKYGKCYFKESEYFDTQIAECYYIKKV